MDDFLCKSVHTLWVFPRRMREERGKEAERTAVPRRVCVPLEQVLQAGQRKKGLAECCLILWSPRCYPGQVTAFLNSIFLEILKVGFNPFEINVKSNTPV